jgi:hypothetical protein
MKLLHSDFMGVMANKMELLTKYVNGNYTVKIFNDGTKVRFTEEDEFLPQKPESIDIKITDCCDMGCKYCHEQSTLDGKHADINKLLKVISDLHIGTEVAIGGGNPLSHPDLIHYLTKLKDKGLIANITINQNHLKTYFSLIEKLIKEDLVKGIGISISNSNFEYVSKLKLLSNNIVYHVIAGVNKVSIMDELIALGNCKVLILGYKKFGRGVDYHNSIVDDNIENWTKSLRNYIRKCTISFDNLAIEQLNVRSLFTKEGWDRFYMGDDFCFTMYIDAVKQEYAPTSRSSTRVSFKKCSLLEYFTKYRTKVKI